MCAAVTQFDFYGRCSVDLKSMPHKLCAEPWYNSLVLQILDDGLVLVIHVGQLMLLAIGFLQGLTVEHTGKNLILYQCNFPTPL